MQGSGIAGDGIDGTLTKYRQRLAATNPPDGLLSVELSDFNRVLNVKQDLWDDIQAAKQAGRRNEADELGKIYRELDASLESASDGYRSANDNFRAASGDIETVDAGRAADNSRRRSTDTIAEFDRLPADPTGTALPASAGAQPYQQQSRPAFRTGYADSLIARSESQSSGANRAIPLQTPKRSAEIDAFATDAPRLQSQIAREDTMAETRQIAIGGSRTANNEANIDDVQSFDLGMLANIFAGNFKPAAIQGAQKVATMATGRNEATQKLIADALLSNDPTVLVAAIKQAAQMERSNKLLQALARHQSQQQLGVQ
jgi:hypothetical protein